MNVEYLVVYDLRNLVVSMQQGIKRKQRQHNRLKTSIPVENQKRKWREAIKGAHGGCVTWTYAAAQRRVQHQDRGRERTGGQPRRT